MKTIHVVGDLNLDVILSGMRDAPAFGREILATARTFGPGGSAANTALVLAAVGARVKLYSQIGGDPQGDILLKLLRQHRLSAECIVRADAEATGVTVSLAYPEERMYITCPGTVASTRLEALPAGYLAAGDHLHLASYFLQKALRPDIGRLLQAAKALGMTTSLDPGGDPEQQWDFSLLDPYLRHLDWLMPNADEILGISGATDLRRAMATFAPDTPGLVVKDGKDGAWLRYRGKIESFPVRQTTVVDPTGAGDSFNAGFLHALITNNASARDAMSAGLDCAARAVASPGLPLA